MDRSKKEMLFTMETQSERQLLDTRRLNRWLRKKQCGGRGLFARTVDYAALRAVLLAAAYLFFAARFPFRATALLLAAIFLAICMLILRLYREISFARFRIKELSRIRDQLLTDKLLLLDVPGALTLVSGLCPLGETPVVLQRALPVDANALLAVLRTHRDCGKLHVFSCTPFDAGAQALSQRMESHVALHAPRELYQAAREAGVTVDSGELNAYLLTCLRRRPRGTRQFSLPDAPAARKYACIALLLLGLSFFTDYALYYRLLSGVCMSIAAAGASMRRTARSA